MMHEVASRTKENIMKLYSGVLENHKLSVTVAGFELSMCRFDNMGSSMKDILVYHVFSEISRGTTGSVSDV
jgi:hypothetical protein